MTQDSASFDRTTWQRFIAIAMPFFTSENQFKAIGMLVLLISLSLATIGLNILMSYSTRDFTTALADRHEQEFYRYLLMFAFLVLIVTPVTVLYRYTEEKLALIWRKWLSQHFLRKYFASHAYYRINVEKRIDNPDQRIADEIRSFTGTSLSFLLILLNSIINLCAWIGILWSISAKLTFVLVAYALFGSIMTIIIGRRLVPLNFMQLKREADFRYGLVHVRDNSESIAFYRGEDKESAQVKHRLRDALRNLNYLIAWHRNLAFFTTGYNYISQILPVVIVAPLFFSKEIEYGVVTQATIAFGWVLGAVSLIIVQFERLSAFAAGIARLGAFWEALEQGEPLPEKDALPTITVVQGPRLACEHLTVLTPHRQRTLIRDLNLTLEDGESLFIQGPSGVGKSSFLRAIAGLWTEGEGLIMRPALDDAVFLPQRPYMLLGSLRAQLRYTGRYVETPDRQLVDMLKEVGLEDLHSRVGGLEAELDWSHVLSLGEQQRIAFARLLLARPRMAFLDESTTALDQDNELRLYELVMRTVKSVVSIGHRQTLMDLHTYCLELKGDGEWKLSPVKRQG